MDGMIEIIGIGESLMSEMMLFQIAPERFDIVELGSVFRQPSIVSQDARAAKAARGLARVDRAVVEHEHDRFRRRRA